jgi:uncharacterized protein
METFENLTKDIISNKDFNKLKNDLHHGITRYDHSYRVAKWTYKICKLFSMRNGEKTTRAALLHDFYTNGDLEGLSSVKKLGAHPNVALNNALKYYDLDYLEQDIIKSHMFPCNLTVPKYKESFLVSMVDKTVATYEMIRFKAPLYLGIYTIFLFELIKLHK